LRDRNLCEIIYLKNYNYLVCGSSERGVACDLEKVDKGTAGGRGKQPEGGETRRDGGETLCEDAK